MQKTTTHSIRKLKGRQPIVVVTAYDAPTARHADEAGVDVILVGDSLGNVVLGHEHSVPVTLDDICHHTAAVVRARPAALVAADLPFAEAHYSFDRVLASCQRILQQAGAGAVKIEGGAEIAPVIARLTAAGVPVWGHIGLQPQQVLALGRYKKFGGDDGGRDALLADARALEQAGVFALLIEHTDSECARAITAAAGVPTIGIGAGPHCDGQVLVAHDLLGLTPPGRLPGFARQFASAGAEYRKGFAAFAEAVRAKKFPL
ncbi:MAG: 3-methyl-2-oxobutanoate hydroxymethyltransferase [Opitutaceae bacterium]|jgi:3-methyl-2-oxobutanoate hydroxymethyltransferase|nr:3-methyl-2-oxobutanoate hydroxymethyltransferase [Opitutaceae bacterium]